MNEQERTQLAKTQAALLARRKNTTVILSSAADKPQKCEPDSRPLLPAEDWPPASLEPVVFESNLARWEAFDWSRHPQLSAAKPLIVDWYNGLPSSGALVLAGNVGCGKTHIAEALQDLFGKWRISFYGEIRLAKEIQSTYQGKGQTEEGLIQRIFRQDLFVLDDLGTYQAKDTKFILNVYNRLFNDYLTVMAKPMIITTNLPMIGEGSIEDRIGARSYSRLCGALARPENYVSLFDVPDYRIEQLIAKG